MKTLPLTAAFLAITSFAGCKSKDDQAKELAAKMAAEFNKAGSAAAAAAAKPVADPATKPAAPVAAALQELDLSPIGDAWKGWVAMAPAGAKLDDGAIMLPGDDSDSVSLTEAAGWKDFAKGIGDDKDNSNIVKSDTEVRYERNPPLGKQWLVSVLVMNGETQFSCQNGMTGTMTSAAVADVELAICKSIKKK